MNFRPFALAVSLAAFAVISAPVAADPPHGKGKPEKAEKHHGKKQHQYQNQSGNALVVVNLSRAEARRIALQYHTVGYVSLPPGIRKNLARGKPLPPGLAKRAVPANVLGQLPRYEGYEWQTAGSDLILVSLATAVIAEVLTGVFD